jgi:type I restriction enzyme S subunit
MVQLGEVARIGAGQGAPQDSAAFSKDGHPFIRAGSLELLCEGDDSALERIDNKAAAKHRLRLYSPDTIVFAKSGMSATKNRIHRLRKPAYVVNHLATVEPTIDVDPTYVCYWLEHFNPTRLIQDLAYPSISLEDINEVVFPLPSLSDQQRVAWQLEQADRLRRTRRYALELSATFLPAAFLQLFGDRFHKGPFYRFGDLVKITGGGTPSRDRPEYFQGRIPWLTSKDMRGDYIWDTEEHITAEGIKNSATNRFRRSRFSSSSRARF